ncbi:MAG: peptidoglycan DD-metalloendopeptidase family protein, partial [Reinekea forsetii]|nr:peptidoglycan DD-metalloendopeptidase family protein [Reinekea forsetii]
DVLAVRRGRVVFADFFKANGLLMIIDHGGGIWTLYGRNQALLRDVGSWVDAGDVIATVGQSGGYNESGLYFEVRKDGEPQNPANWLQKR